MVRQNGGVKSPKSVIITMLRREEPQAPLFYIIIIIVLNFLSHRFDGVEDSIL